MSVEVMSLEEMRKYGGTNPRPDDFDGFWESGMRQVKDWDPQPRLVPAAVQLRSAQCFDLFCQGAVGWA